MNERGQRLHWRPGARAAHLAAWLGLAGLGWLLVACGPGRTPSSTPTTRIPVPAARTATPRPSFTPSPAPTATAKASPPPSPSASPTALFTPTPPTASPAPAGEVIAPLLTVTGHLYCRTGPGVYYPARLILQPGQVVQWAGANKIFYDWALVLVPEEGLTCWAARRWLQGANDPIPTTVPQVTPPPPPPGAFKPIRHQWPLVLPFCPAFWSPAVQFQLKNLGPEPIRSMRIELTVLDSGAVYRTETPDGIPTCAKVRTQIPPGATVAVAARTREDLTNQRVRLYLQGCTQPNFQGACVAFTWTLTLEPPPAPVWFRP